MIEQTLNKFNSIDLGDLNEVKLHIKLLWIEQNGNHPKNVDASQFFNKRMTKVLKMEIR